MELTGLSQFLLSLGGPGAIILYLLWRQRDLEARNEALQTTLIAMLEKTMREVTAALVASAEAMRANNLIQDRAGLAAASLAEAVRVITATLEHVEDELKRLREAR